MDYFIEEIEEADIERMQRRKERIERMRREKKRQMRRRRRLKMILHKSVRILAVVLIMAVAISAFSRKSEKEFSSNHRTEEEKKSSWFFFGNRKEKPEEGEFATETMETFQEQGGISSESQNAEEQELRLAVDDGTGYGFESSSDTKTIYKEEIISSNVILIDESTDRIVASKSAKERISPASMTKVLTILVAAEHITEEQLDDTFTITREITDYGYVNDCSAVGFLDGEEVTVRDLFYGTILTSGSDAALGLATYVAGSHEAFVDMMNEKLNELGLGATSHYTNCVGLYDKDHYSTVYDMAVIMKAAIQSEFCKEVLSEHRYVTGATTEHPEGIDISNWFLRRIEDKETGGEVMCAKTGYVMQSKNCAVSYGVFADGKPYICVTAGSSSSWRCIYDHVEIYNAYV